MSEPNWDLYGSKALHDRAEKAEADLARAVEAMQEASERIERGDLSGAILILSPDPERERDNTVPTVFGSGRRPKRGPNDYGERPMSDPERERPPNRNTGSPNIKPPRPDPKIRQSMPDPERER